MAPIPLSPTAVQALVFSLESGRIAISAGYAAGALIIYDYFVTLASEVKHVWKSNKSLVFALFIVQRYSTLLYQLTFSMSFFLPIHSDKGFVLSHSIICYSLHFVISHRCASIIYVEQVCFIFSSAALSGIFALRSFAIYQRNWFILGGLVILAAVKIFISAVDFFVSAQIIAQKAPQFHQFGFCSETMTGPPKWNTASAALALVFDTIVLGLTLAKTLKTSFERTKLKLGKSYSYYFLRDGLVYYLIIEMLLLFTVIFNQVPALSVRVARVVIILQTSVAPALAQRLILNLRSVEKILNGKRTDEVVQSLPSIDFAHGSVLGNIGAPLRVDEDDNRVGAEEMGYYNPAASTTVREGFEDVQMIVMPDGEPEGLSGSQGHRTDTLGFVI